MEYYQKEIIVERILNEDLDDMNLVSYRIVEIIRMREQFVSDFIKIRH